MVGELTHIRLLPSKMDIYPVLPYTDVLITDYSSILYDYVLMEDKDVILYLYDFQDYEKERNFTRPFDELVVGKKVFTFDALLQVIRSGDHRLDSSEREAFVSRCWGDDLRPASSRIAGFFLAQ